MQSGIAKVIFYGTAGMLAIAILIIAILVKIYNRNKLEKLLIKTRLSVHSEAFAMFSEEIHDNIGQLLSLAQIQLATFQMSSNREPVLNQLKQTLGSMGSEIRQLGRILNGNQTLGSSLIVMLQQLADKISFCNSVSFRFTTMGQDSKLSDHSRFILYRIAQEAIQNCLKHAMATVIYVDLVFEDKLMKLTITDNGVGFDGQKEIHLSDGLGLKHMASRTKLLNGIIKFGNSANKGAFVSICIPYSKQIKANWGN